MFFEHMSAAFIVATAAHTVSCDKKLSEKICYAPVS
jgi:hypothetical protein